ncbi:MAG: PLP-dependent aminotransferase family protein [Methylotenera sp.]
MLRSWDLKIELNHKIGLAVYMQIVQKVIEEIQLGRLQSSTAMPGTRDLAKILGVNRKTVVLAYDELVAQGWLTTEFRRGSFVSSSIPYIFKPVVNTNRIMEEFVGFSTSSYVDSKIDYEASNSDLIDFNDGIPDTRLIPFEILARAFRHALVTSSRANRLGYDNPKGALALRKSIANMLNMERAMHVDVDSICIVRGSQMGIFLAARILTTPNDCVVFETLTYPAAREAFRSCGANVVNVGLDEHGIKLGELEDVCRKHRVRAVYVTPHHQFPTTVMMTAERRLGLLLLAEQYDFVVLEDDYDHEFHFSHHPVFPLASADRAGRVIYVGSLSKVLAPGLRIGYIVAPPKFINRCAAEIMLIDRQGNSVTELAASELMDSGEVKRHIRKSFKIYSERRTLLASLLREELSNLIDFDKPDGGLAFWLRLKSNMKTEDIQELSLNEKIRILPGAIFTLGATNSHAIRLGFGSLNASELTIGILRLKRVLTKI